MKSIIIAAMIVISSASFANADILDDNLAKAEKSVINANKKLDAAKACVATIEARAECKATMVAKAEKALANAQKRLAAID
jgi:multidrug resistance efflux pump